MDKSFSSEFEGEEFKKNLAKYEEMISAGKSAYLDADQLSEIAEYYASLDDYEKSMKTIEYSLKIHPGAIELLTLKAHLLIETDRVQEAKAIVYSIPESYTYDVKFLKAILFIKEKNIDEAEKILEDMDASEGKNSEEEEYYLDAAYAFMDNEYPDEALQWFEKALKIIPEDIDVQQDYAECSFRTGQIDRAITWYNKVLDEDPYSVESWFGLGKSFFMKNDFQNAIEAFDFILAIKPDHHYAIILQAQAYAELNNCKKASELYTKYSEYFPDEARPYTLAGMCYFNIDEYEKALECFRIAIEKDPKMEDPMTIDTFQSMAVCNLFLKDYENAFKAINKAIELDEGYDSNLFVTKGNILLGMENKTNAKAAFMKALEVDGFDNPETYINIALAYNTHHDFDPAIHILNALQEDFPGHGLSYVYMAYFYLQKEDKDNFKKYFTKALEEAPDTIIQFVHQLGPKKEEIKELFLNLKQSLEDLNNN